ncbi:PREDICTED: uncharacterized protein LOC106748223 isoform X2 [Dinoponera quadriceps]|nr:PREDICTED: uncharacterized protein LOC106748223 isoform X2 [Dinoponera quadriceps]
MPKITEMALVAVDRKSVYKNGQNSLPRVLHKLILPINPKKMMPVRVEYLTKLYNDDMQLLQPFEVGTYELIIHFLSRLKPPIGFVAHNGDAFDYPILLSELSCINKTLDDAVLCIDTYKMFRDYFNGISNNNIPHKCTLNCTLNAAEIEALFDDGYNELLFAVLDSVMMEKKTVVQNEASTSSLQRYPHDIDILIDALHDDTCEERNAVGDGLENREKRENDHRTPTRQKAKRQNAADKPSKKNGHRRRLDFNCKGTSPVNLKLCSIYEHMFESNFDSHSAEADCIAMLRCVTQVADYFLRWSDENAFPLVRCDRAQQSF